MILFVSNDHSGYCVDQTWYKSKWYYNNQVRDTCQRALSRVGARETVRSGWIPNIF